MTLLDVSQILGGVGDFVGAVAVVVTLIFLTVEIRRNTQALRLATSESIVQGIIENNRMSIEDAEVSDVLLRAITDPSSLNRNDRNRFNGHANNLMYGWQRSYYSQKANALEADIWRGQCRGIVDILKVPLYRRRWDRLAPYLGEEFVDFVTRELLPRVDQT